MCDILIGQFLGVSSIYLVPIGCKLHLIFLLYVLANVKRFEFLQVHP